MNVREILPFLYPDYYERQKIYSGTIIGELDCDPITKQCKPVQVIDPKEEEIPGTAPIDRDVERAKEVMQEITRAIVKPIAGAVGEAVRTAAGEAPVAFGLGLTGAAVVGAIAILGLVVLIRR